MHCIIERFSSCDNNLTPKMPKVRRMRALPADQARASCYPNSSMNIEQHKSEEQLGSADDVKEWEEARCPICMEHPHNAVLLKCSAHENGCRPYMCNTSYRHSNCLDQFCKSFAPHASITLLQEIPFTNSAFRRGEHGLDPGQARQFGNQLQPKLVCPLCRGEIYGYHIVEPARKFMNSRARSCSSEMCDFSGTYSKLRKHARSEHPSIRPSEVDPMRQSDWTRLERERDLEDVLSSLHPEFVEESSEENTLSAEFSGWMSSILEAMFRTLGLSLMVHLSDVSGDREQLHNRRSERTSRADYDMEASPLVGRSTDLSSEGMPRQTTRWAHDDASAATRRDSNLSSVRVRQTPEWSSENTSRFWSSQSRSSFTSSGRPRFRQMRGHSSRSVHSFTRYPRRSTDNTAPHSRRLRWRDERWSPYNSQR
ncbi:uncharacterized protein LOC121259781 isoform X1 [Juglans microcarpa x Juglans regia]|uniref:uncharacterized protein LOC121259781 isoform X1 n=2 Tax=Juglans microcarpa x Juglans regia TaxID=2249226 RepID=UPI001B7E9990|nr:uncharacterized protein LOC121259781 isoform X1 [Juglans microcarpa x Juglans regia]XP_041017468.1 uncharacterized protein LOC121259781 isoform X1 [Juglans microcarpa x Juglans regia]